MSFVLDPFEAVRLTDTWVTGARGPKLKLAPSHPPPRKGIRARTRPSHASHRSALSFKAF